MKGPPHRMRGDVRTKNNSPDPVVLAWVPHVRGMLNRTRSDEERERKSKTPTQRGREKCTTNTKCTERTTVNACVHTFAPKCSSSVLAAPPAGQLSPPILFRHSYPTHETCPTERCQTKEQKQTSKRPQVARE